MVLFLLAVFLNLAGAIGFFFLSEASPAWRLTLLAASAAASAGWFLVGADGVRMLLGSACAIGGIVYVFYFKHVYL